MKEEWKDVPGWEGMYKVSNFGRCMSVRTGNIKPTPPNNYGYPRLVCYLKGRATKFFVHKLVATLFVDGFFEGAVVNHKDGNKATNHFENLEWVTRSENERHAYRNGLKVAKKQARPILIVPDNAEDPSLLSFETIKKGADYLGIEEKRMHHLIKTMNGVVPERDCCVYVARLTTSPDECKGVGCK